MSRTGENHVPSSHASPRHRIAEENGGSVMNSPITEGQVDPKRRLFQSVTGLFSKVFEDSAVLSIDPLRCLSIKKLRSRPICRWGIRRIKDVILGHSNSDTFIKGFVSTGKFGVVAEIPEENLELVVEHFMGNGKSEEEARSLAASGKWYHVVDGGHLHQALVEIVHEFSEKFAGFRWPVVGISWQSEDDLLAIGRMCNEMQKETHIIDFPLPDAMQSLRDIIDKHSSRTGVSITPGQRVRPGFIKEVIGIYSGCPGYSCSTLRNVCGSVLKMSSCFVSSMRSLLTEECDEYWETLGTKRPFGEDTRVYKKLISTQSLKRATTFLDQEAMTDEDRVNVIHRLRFLARERESFKAFQSAEIESQSRCVIAVRKEIDKFDKFLDGESWPSDMENLKRNMLQTTLLDGVVKEHVGAQDQLLPEMVTAYLKATGAHGSQKLGQYQRRIEIEQTQEGEIIGTARCRGKRPAGRNQEACQADFGNGAEVNEGDAAVDPGVDRHGCVDSTTPNNEWQGANEEDPDAILDKSGVKVHLMTLLEYERNSADIGGSFDIVIADPFQKVPSDASQDGKRKRENETDVRDQLVDEKGVTLYVQSIRRLLTAGGFCFMFLNWSNIQEWASCSTKSQLEIICEPFLVMRDAGRIQKMTMKGLQNVYDPALVLRKPGKHRDGFDIDKTSPYVHLPACRMPRWCNVIDGVPPPAQRLTFKPSRAHVRPNERPCALIIEILTTFCPTNGNVLDTSAGVLTTGLACIATDRQCVLLETDEKCLFHAKPRLQEFAKSKLAEKGSVVNDSGIAEPVNEGTSNRGVSGQEVHASNEDDLDEPHIQSQTEDDFSENNSGSEQKEASRSSGGTPTRLGTRPSIGIASEEDTVSESPNDHGTVDESTSSYAGHTMSPRNHQRGGSFSIPAGSVPEGQQQQFVDRRTSQAVSYALRISVDGPSVAQKRNRQVQSPSLHRRRSAGRFLSTDGSSTPSAYRRSKRSRRPVARYELE